MTQGIVTDTTLMVNTDYTADAVALLRQHGITRVGLHLNITFGVPVLPTDEVPSLVDAAGRFHRKIAVSAPQLDIAQVEREWRAQLAKFQKTGLGLTHLDSHHHAHSYPGLLEIAITLAKEVGAPLRQTGQDVREKIIAAGVRTTDNICLDFYSTGATADNLAAIVAGHRDGVLEIMCHPAVDGELIYQISSYNADRQREFTILTSPAIKEIIKGSGVELVSFDAVR